MNKPIKVIMTVPQKAIDDAVKSRIKELEHDNKRLTQALKRIDNAVKSEVIQ